MFDVVEYPEVLLPPTGRTRKCINCDEVFYQLVGGEWVDRETLVEIKQEWQ